ncbi:MAG: glycoside hydrolase family 2 TIM barrel-domain containing protein [Victivallaceae bacterium]|nr:glycoside hydrolase family 2 TIM barrel-domain containing protein [Victivallaceae bacterium]
MNLGKQEQLDLNGVWSFVFREEGLPSAAELAQLDYPQMETVPGCFDTSSVHRFARGCGVYRREVFIGGLCRLNIGGIGVRGRVFWDGRTLGELPIPFEDEEFVFEAGDEKAHTLVIAVDNRIDGSDDSLWAPYYDFYSHGGIYRDVSIGRLDRELRFVDCRVTTLDERTRTVRIDYELEGEKAGVSHPLECRVDGRLIYASGDGGMPARGNFTVNLPGAALWSVDHPVLHTLELSCNPAAKTFCAFGIRRVALQNGRITLNGEAVKLIGVNRHDAHPDFGYAVPVATVLHDLMQIKAMGANFIRGSHYPQSESMLALCDRLGLLVWEETLGWGNNPGSLKSRKFLDAQDCMARHLVRKSWNHPSVILHGFLNEVYSDCEEAEPVVRHLAELFRELNPSIPVSFATCRAEETERCVKFVDVIAYNVYPGWYVGDFLAEEFRPEDIAARLAQVRSYANLPENREKALLITEIGASTIAGAEPGDRWSEEYQADVDEEAVRLVMQDDRYSGIAIWLFADSRTFRTKGAVMRPRCFNNKGIVTEHRIPKQAYRRLTMLLRGGKNRKES